MRNEIKTVAEETSNAHVAVKRPLDNPPVLENEAKKRRVELPFLQKGNRGNEMDILDALQGNLSSPSPTPSPDIWSTAKTFEIPPTSRVVTHAIPAHSAEKAGPSKSTAKKEPKKQVATEKPNSKQPVVKPKSSPGKKAKAPKNTTSPVSKLASPKVSTHTEVTKENSPSLMKSPVSNKKKSAATPKKETKTKQTPKKDKKPAAKAKKPVIKSPPTSTAAASVKENIIVKESMPKLIIKPIKEEVNKEPQFSVSEFLPPDEVEKQENIPEKKSKVKDGASKKQKPKKKKEGVFPLFKVESNEKSAPSTSEGLKFSMADFAVTPPVGMAAGGMSVDPTLEHKKKKKKRKEKDKDKEKKKDKNKKVLW